MAKEIRVYGVKPTGENGLDDYADVAELSNLDFITEAEEQGEVSTIDTFFRDLEEFTTGASSPYALEDLFFRVFLVDPEKTGEDFIVEQLA